MDARDFYRTLNTKNEIKDFGGYGDFTADQMIWFAEEYAKKANPIESQVRQSVSSADVLLVDKALEKLLIEFWKYTHHGNADTPEEEIKSGVKLFIASKTLPKEMGS